MRGEALAALCCLSCGGHKICWVKSTAAESVDRLQGVHGGAGRDREWGGLRRAVRCEAPACKLSRDDGSLGAYREAHARVLAPGAEKMLTNRRSNPTSDPVGQHAGSNIRTHGQRVGSACNHTCSAALAVIPCAQLYNKA